MLDALGKPVELPAPNRAGEPADAAPVMAEVEHADGPGIRFQRADASATVDPADEPATSDPEGDAEPASATQGAPAAVVGLDDPDPRPELVRRSGRRFAAVPVGAFNRQASEPSDAEATTDDACSEDGQPTSAGIDVEVCTPKTFATAASEPEPVPEPSAELDAEPDTGPDAEQTHAADPEPSERRIRLVRRDKVGTSRGAERDALRQRAAELREARAQQQAGRVKRSTLNRG